MAQAKTNSTVLLEKVNLSVVDHHLAEAGQPTTGTAGERVERLVAVQATVPKAFLGDCDNCQGASDVRGAVCPFCGVGDEEADLGKAVDANPNATIAPGGAPKVEKAAAAPKPPISPKAAKAPKKRSSVVREAVAILDDEDPTDENPTIDVTGVAVTSEALDRNVAQIHALRKDAVVGYWRLGQAIFANYEGRLYTQRVDEAGRPKYKAFNQFVVAELGLSVSHAYSLMDVAVNFSESDVLTIGVAKLTLVARLPPADREGLIQKLRSENTPLSTVKDEVRRLAGPTRPASAAERGGGRGFAGDDAKGREVNRAAAKSVTVGLYLGKQTIPLMRRDAPDRAALTLAHDPYGEEMHVNGVKSTYRIVKSETGLDLIITRTREAGAGPAPKPQPKKGSRTAKVSTKPAKAAKAAKKRKAAKAAKPAS